MNSVQEIGPSPLFGGDDERFRPGNVLVSARKLSTIFIVDRTSGEVVWQRSEGLDKQHEARLLPSSHASAGLISLFNNRAHHRLTGSRIEIFEPVGRRVFSYASPYFFSSVGGIVQVLPNESLLVSSSHSGRVFELTRSGEVVWQFELRALLGLIAFRAFVCAHDVETPLRSAPKLETRVNLHADLVRQLVYPTNYLLAEVIPMRTGVAFESIRPDPAVFRLLPLQEIHLHVPLQPDGAARGASGALPSGLAAIASGPPSSTRSIGKGSAAARSWWACPSRASRSRSDILPASNPKLEGDPVATSEAALRLDPRSLRRRPDRPVLGMAERRARPQRAVGSLLVLGLMLLAFPASAASIKVPKTVYFAKSARVRAAIQNECGLQTMVPAAIVQYSSDAELVNGKGNLDLEISQVHAPGGWVFSGPKWLEVTGKLHRGGKVVGTFRAKRFSVDPTAGGVCGMLAKCAQNIGVDVAHWLESPTMNAEIGDAQ